MASEGWYWLMTRLAFGPRWAWMALPESWRWWWAEQWVARNRSPHV